MSDLRKLADAATSRDWRAHVRAPLPDAREWGAWVLHAEGDDDRIVAECEPEDAAFIAAANPQAVIGLLDKVDAAASRWQWTVATTPGGGAILSYRGPGQSGFALIASALPRKDGMLAVTVLGQKRTAAADLPAALATIRAVLGADVPEIPNERSES